MPIYKGAYYCIEFSDIDRDADRAGVHPFNKNGKAYGYDVIDSGTGEVVDTIYGPSEKAAEYNAVAYVQDHGGIAIV